MGFGPWKLPPKEREIEAISVTNCYHKLQQSEEFEGKLGEARFLRELNNRYDRKYKFIILTTHVSRRELLNTLLLKYKYSKCILNQAIFIVQTLKRLSSLAPFWNCSISHSF